MQSSNSGGPEIGRRVFVAALSTAGAGLSACGVSQQPTAGATGSVRWTMTGALLPGASGSVSYRMRVQ